MHKNHDILPFWIPFENLSDAFLLTESHTYETLLCNHRALTLLGFADQRNVQQQKITDFLALQFDTLYHIQSSLAVQKNISLNEIQLRKQNHDWFWASLCVSSFAYAGKSYWLWKIQDISPNKEFEYKFLRNQQQISEISQRFSMAAQIAEIGIWDMEIESGKLFWNDKMYEIYGVSPKQKVTHKFFIKLLHPEDQNILNNIIKTTIRQERDFQTEFRILRKGKIRHVRSNGKVYKDENGLIQRIIGVSLDLTEQKTAEQKLVYAKETAINMMKSRTQFVSVLSHEIRNSLQAMIGITQLLIEDNQQPEQTQRIEALKFATDNLLLLVNDILDFSKLEQGNSAFNLQDFSLLELLRSLKQTFEFKAKAKGLALEIDADREIPSILQGDPSRLSQVLTNLIGNAIKFTEKGWVGIFAEIQELTETHVSIEFSVSDTGVGIPSEKQDMIFEEFSQAHTEHKQNFGGTGLGLAISRQILLLQNSTMQVQSKEGEGSRFYFVLSFARSSLSSLPTRKTQSDYDLGGVRVLVAEDNQVNQLVISQFLKRWKAQSEIVSNGKMVLEKLKNKKYDLLLLDLQMPVLNGYETAKEIRKKYTMEELPIIALSADSWEEVEEQMQGTNINDFIRKPFAIQDFYEKIKQYTPENLFQKATEMLILPKIDFLNLRQVQALAGNEKQVLYEFVRLTSHAFEEFQTQYSEALRGENYEEFRKITHKMISTLRFLEFEVLLELIAEAKNFWDKKNSRLIKENTEKVVYWCKKGILALQSLG